MIRRTEERDDRPLVRSGWFLKGSLVALLFALNPTNTEAQALNETGRWQGPYFLGAPQAEGKSYNGAHVAVLKGPADTTRALVFGQGGGIGVWSFVGKDSLTIPRTRIRSPIGSPPPLSPDSVNVHGVVPSGQDLFCGGHAMSKTGRLVVVGGQYAPDVGTETPYEFNPLYTSPTTPQSSTTGTPPWRQLASNARGRWYPTATALPSGLLASSGTKWGYVWTFGGSSGSLQNDLRSLGMGRIVDWSSPTGPQPPTSPDERKDHWSCPGSVDGEHLRSDVARANRAFRPPRPRPRTHVEPRSWLCEAPAKSFSGAAG